MNLRAPSRFAAAAVACLYLGLPPAHAQEPSKVAIAAAREVITTKGGAQMFNPITHGVVETVKDSYLRTNPNLSRELNDVALTIHNEIEANQSALLDEVAKIYARHFTEQELKNLLVFYKTPLGQKWAREEPVAIEEGLARAKDWTDTYAETLMGRFRTEMRKKGSPL
jgi:uncharacterized protein